MQAGFWGSAIIRGRLLIIAIHACVVFPRHPCLGVMKCVCAKVLGRKGARTLVVGSSTVEIMLHSTAPAPLFDFHKQARQKIEGRPSH